MKNTCSKSYNIIAAMILFAMLCGCGAKGALYLPHKKGESGAAATPPPSSQQISAPPPSGSTSSSGGSGVSSISGGASGRQF